jgi:hypothetical protein
VQPLRSNHVTPAGIPASDLSPVQLLNHKLPENPAGISASDLSPVQPLSLRTFRLLGSPLSDVSSVQSVRSNNVIPGGIHVSQLNKPLNPARIPRDLSPVQPDRSKSLTLGGNLTSANDTSSVWSRRLKYVALHSPKIPHNSSVMAGIAARLRLNKVSFFMIFFLFVVIKTQYKSKTKNASTSKKLCFF